MQTFYPLPSAVASATVLDDKRLNNQPNEVKPLIRAVTGESTAWANHPAAIMWRGHAPALALYGYTMCREIERRWGSGLERAAFFTPYMVTDPQMPSWLGDDDFHRAHRSQLLAKNPDWYGQFGWDVPPGLPYVWPGDPHAAVRATACPSCGALAGFSCTTAAGKPSGFHSARRGLALPA